MNIKHKCMQNKASELHGRHCIVLKTRRWVTIQNPTIFNIMTDVTVAIIINAVDLERCDLNLFVTFCLQIGRKEFYLQLIPRLSV